MMWLIATLLLSFMLDYWLGEPKRFHPLIGFGNCAIKVEKWLNSGSDSYRLVVGGIAWCLLVLPIPILYFYFLQQNSFSASLVMLIDILVIYWALGHKSLREHGLQIYHALQAGDIKQAREYCGYIVSRNTSELTEQEISRATTESMLENGHDAVIATLVWYLIGGAPIVIIHRLANTLDAMWGYRNERFNLFGRCAARADDVLGFVPAKITSALFALQGIFTGKPLLILKQAHRQAKNYKSHNGGWVMSAGATLINVKLGGEAIYHGKVVNSPTLGQGEVPQAKHIQASLSLVIRAALLLILFVFLFDVFR